MSGVTLPPPLDKLAKSSRVQRNLGIGDSLFYQSSTTTGLFYLVSGDINLKRETMAGHTITIHRARSGDTFAEASVFSEVYHCTATAATQAVVIECKKAAILQLLDSDINFSRLMLARFAAQIQETRRRVELLSIRSAGERILAAIKDGLLTEDITTFADIIGLAPETVYRTLAQLNQKGLIEKTARGRYSLADGRMPGRDS